MNNILTEYIEVARAEDKAAGKAAILHEIHADKGVAKVYFLYKGWPHRLLHDIQFANFENLKKQVDAVREHPPIEMYPVRPADNDPDESTWQLVRENFGINKPNKK